MSEFQDDRFGSDLFKKIDQYIVEKGAALLETAPYVADEDAALMRTNMKAHERDVADLMHVLQPGDLRSEAVLEIVSKLMLGAFITGVSATLSPEADVWRSQLKTHIMRFEKAKQDAAREEAQISAIAATEAFRANPYVAADAIFEELGGSLPLSTLKRRLAVLRRRQNHA